MAYSIIEKVLRKVDRIRKKCYSESKCFNIFVTKQRERILNKL